MTLKPLLLAIAVAAYPSFHVHAESTQDVAEIIVVTADFRKDDLQRIPASISVVTEETIQRRNAQHLEEILAAIPNVNLSKGSARTRFLQIRGIGERGQFAEPLNPSVGMIVDGVDFSGIGTGGSLFDVEQVEVLRGPQGTIYGANALAGLINVRTNAPTETFAGNVRLEAGEFNSYAVGGAASGPISERVRYRVSARRYASDGFIDNSFLDTDDTDDLKETVVRGRLAIDANETTPVNVSVGYIDLDNGYDAFSLDNNRTTFSDEPGHDRQETAYASVDAVWESPRSYSLEARLSGSVSDSRYGYDEDWSFVGLHPDEYSSTDNYMRDRSNITGEARWVSKDAGRIFNDTTHWLLGFWGMSQQVDLTREYTFLAEDFDSQFEIVRYATFGQLESALTDRTTLTLGLRLERHEAEYEDSDGVDFGPTDNLLGGRAALDYALNDSSIVYASISRGYKAGGFNTDGSLDEDLRQYDPETLWNFELGLKGLWYDNRLTARLAAFYMLRDDVQIQSSLVRERPDGSSEFIDFVGNAAEGTNSGVEAEIIVVPTEVLELFANIGTLNSKYKDFTNAAGDDLDGREQAHAPGYQFHLGGELAFANGIFARLEYEGRDEFFFSDSHDSRSTAYELLNASVGYEAERWNVTLWGRNLTDEDYFVRGFFFGNDPRDGYAAKTYTQLGEPQRAGVTFAMQW